MKTPNEILAEVKEVTKSVDTSNEVVWNCGYAWVIIPARGKFHKFCKENKIGYKNYGAGWKIEAWYLSEYKGQDMGIKRNICYAALEVLHENGINGQIDYNLD